MRPLLLLLFFCSLGLTARAQQITGVMANPAQPTACQAFRLVFSGQMPSQSNISSFAFQMEGSQMTIDLFSTGGGGIGPFSQTIEYFGPFAAGTYAVAVQLHHNGQAITHTYNSSLTILAGEQPDMGVGTLGEVCNTDDPFPLADLVEGGLPGGGIWYGPAGTVLQSPMFVPGSSDEGTYLYMIPLYAPCDTAYQVVQVIYTPNSDAGGDGVLQVCAEPGAPPVDLFEGLLGTPASGGSWSNAGGPVGNMFVPGVSLAGAYTYTVPGLPPCSDPSATVTVQTVAGPSAGAGDSVVICPLVAEQDLSAFVMGEQTNGLWYSPDGFMVGSHGQLIDVVANGPGTYHYVVTSTLCPADTAFLHVTLLALPCGIGMEGDIAAASMIQLAPNPAHDRVLVTLGDAAGSIGVLQLLAMDGRLHGEYRVPAGETRVWVPLDRMDAGGYMLRLLRAGVPQATARLMVR